MITSPHEREDQCFNETKHSGMVYSKDDEDDNKRKYHLEDVIRDLGGCGQYQIRLSIIVHSMKTISCWSIFSMVFAAAVPSWTCTEGMIGESNVTWSESCTNRNESSCSRFIFDASTFRTIVSEWDLVCDKAWIPYTIASIQMAGLFVGNIFSGHLADGLGRKIPLYISCLILIVSNGMAFLSEGWITFAIARFFMGLGAGFYLTIQYTIQSEVALSKWRALIVAVPSWFVQQAAFAGVAWLVPNWSYLHLINGITGIPFIVTWWFVPESIRWLITRNRLDEAVTIIHQIAKVNRKPCPRYDQLHTAIGNIQREVSSETAAKKYTIVDLFRSWHLVKISALFLANWFTLGFVAYAIQYGISALSGNLFLNMFLFGVASSPSTLLTTVLCNVIGRRKTAVLFLAIACIGCLGAGIMQQTDFHNKGTIVNGFAIVAFLGISTTWSPVQMLTVEVYPTVVRNIGYGFQNTVARIGGIVGPQVAFLDTKFAGIMYLISCGFCLLSIVTAMLLPETMNVALPDNLDDTARPEITDIHASSTLDDEEKAIETTAT